MRSPKEGWGTNWYLRLRGSKDVLSDQYSPKKITGRSAFARVLALESSTPVHTATKPSHGGGLVGYRWVIRRYSFVINYLRISVRYLCHSFRCCPLFEGQPLVFFLGKSTVSLFSYLSHCF